MPGTLTTEYVRLSAIRPANANPRSHDLPSLIASIEQHGYIEPCLEDERTGQLVGGHGRVEALVQMRVEGRPRPAGIGIDDDGEWTVPVVKGWASASDTAAIAALVGLNQISENARWNDYGLAELMEQVATEAPHMLDATGFDSDALDDLLRSVTPERLGEQDPDAPPTPTPTDDPELESAVTTDTASSDEPRNICCPACGVVFPSKV